MKAFELKLLAPQDKGLEASEIRGFLSQVLDACGEGGDTLLLPPDMTRLHSGANILARELYALIGERTPSAQVKVMPALGTHDPMSKEERLAFFGDSIPDDAYLIHDWKNAVEKIGEVPASFVKEVSEGLMDEDITIQVNRELLKPEYKAIFSLGQVVPHEVVGMANYSKNILVGVGGNSIINQSHMLGAMYGMERMMGRIDTPVRKVFDYAQEHFLSKLPLVYILTVTTNTPRVCRFTASLPEPPANPMRKPALWPRRKTSSLWINPSKNAWFIWIPPNLRAPGWGTRPSTALGWPWPRTAS
jgi:hypothetical protein